MENSADKNNSNLVENHRIEHKQKLYGLMVFYQKISKKFNLFKPQDFKICYRKLISELIKLGYLAQENDNNFCQFLADYFKMIPNISVEKVKAEIEDEKKLTKEGLFSTIIVNPQDVVKKMNLNFFGLEKIGLRKLE